MKVEEYIRQKFSSFGFNLTNADLFDIISTAGVDGDKEIDSNIMGRVSYGIAKFIPSLLIRPMSVNEGGFSLSWNIQGMKNYYSLLCRQYGINDEINSDSPKVKFL